MWSAPFQSPPTHFIPSLPLGHMKHTYPPPISSPVFLGGQYLMHVSLCLSPLQFSSFPFSVWPRPPFHCFSCFAAAGFNLVSILHCLLKGTKQGGRIRKSEESRVLWPWLAGVSSLPGLLRVSSQLSYFCSSPLLFQKAERKEWAS